MTSSPFPPTESKPGSGHVHLKLLPPSTPTFSTLSYTYPLKLLPSQPHKLPPAGSNTTNGQLNQERNGEEESPLRPSLVPLLFLLTYGGGLLEGDVTAIEMTLEAGTRLTAATQGMTRIYGPRAEPSPATSLASAKHPNPSQTKLVTSQSLSVHLHAHSALWLAPDPIQPFANSTSTQTQRFYLHHPSASIGLVDWVCEGRKSRGESWTLESWRGKNEIWLVEEEDRQSSTSSAAPRHGSDEPAHKTGRCKERLWVRDNIILAQRAHGHGHARAHSSSSIKTSMHNHGIIGTLILCGPAFHPLSTFFHDEFAALDRIGGKTWDPPPPTSASSSASRANGPAPQQQQQNHDEDHDQRNAAWRRARLRQEKEDGVVWTCTRLPRERGGVTVVKFAAAEAEGGRRWIGGMLRAEGSVAREFGDGGLMFVR